MDKKAIQIRLKNEAHDILLQYISFRKCLLILRSINHEYRKTIIELLKQNEIMTVTQMYIKMRLEQSIVSQHLSQMRKSGVVQFHKQGKNISYSIDENRLLQVLNFANEIVNENIQNNIEQIYFERVDEAVHNLHIFDNEIRLKIIQFIHGSASTNVNNIYKTLKMEQSSTSQQLRILRIFKIVFEKKVGKEVIYALNYPKIERYNTLVTKFLSSK